MWGSDCAALVSSDTGWVHNGHPTSDQRYATSESGEDAQILDLLADDADPLVRCGVANNTYTSAETLTRMASGNDEAVMVSVACNPQTPPEALDKLVDHEDDDVRYGVVCNPQCPMSF